MGRRHPPPTLARSARSRRLARAAAQAQPRLQTPGAARTAGPSGAYAAAAAPLATSASGIPALLPGVGEETSLGARGGTLRRPETGSEPSFPHREQARPSGGGAGETRRRATGARKAPHGHLCFDWLGRERGGGKGRCPGARGGHAVTRRAGACVWKHLIGCGKGRGPRGCLVTALWLLPLRSRFGLRAPACGGRVWALGSPGPLHTREVEERTQAAECGLCPIWLRVQDGL